MNFKRKKMRKSRDGHVGCIICTPRRLPSRQDAIADIEEKEQISELWKEMKEITLQREIRMGYTHYWNYNRKLTDLEIDCMIDIFDTLWAVSKIDIFYGADDLNGISVNGPTFAEGCETFSFPGDLGKTNWCKTKQKPYDTLVAAVLIIADELLPDNAIEAWSDGGTEDWETAMELACKVTGFDLVFPCLNLPAWIEEKT